MTRTEEREYDSGYSDGYRGLTYIPGESAAYRAGFQQGREHARADRERTGA